MITNIDHVIRVLNMLSKRSPVHTLQLKSPSHSFKIPDLTHQSHTHYEDSLTCAGTSHDDVLPWGGVKVFGRKDQGQQSGGRGVTGDRLLDLTPKPGPPVLVRRGFCAAGSGSCDCCAAGN